MSGQTQRNLIGCSLLAVGLVTCLVLIWPVPLYPQEPVASGIFPAQPVWVFRASERIIATPVAQDERVFVRTSRAVYALDATSGTLLWRSESPGLTCLNCFNAPPVACGEFLLVPEGHRSIAAFNISTGTLVWKDSESKDYEVKSIACGNGWAYVGRYGAAFTAYDLSTGRILWEEGGSTRASASLAADSETVYMGADIFVRAYDGRSGDLLWREKMGAFVRSINLVGKILYVGLFEAPLLAIDVDSRTIHWQADFPAGDYPFLIEGGILYIANEDRLAAISAEDGRILWQTAVPGASLGSPVVWEDVVYVRSIGPALYAFEAKTGRRIGSLKIQANPPMVYASDRGPAVAGGWLLVPFGDNRLLAYRPISLDGETTTPSGP